jgi:hypothetical protein
MKKHSISFLIVLGLIAVLFLQPVEPVQAQEPNPTEESPLQLTENTAQGLVLELKVPEVQLEPAVSDTGPCQSLRIPGWGLSGEPGQPALPIKGALIGVPPGSNPSVTVLETGPTIVQEGIDLCPAATLIQPDNPEDVPVDLGERLLIDPVAYAANREFPGPLAQVGDLAMIRSQQVAQVLFQPFWYNPATRQLTTYTHLSVQVDFGTDASKGVSTGLVDEGPFEDILRSHVINYEAARTWRIQPVAQRASLSRPATPSCKISVTQDGMVQATYEAINAACPQIASQDPRNYHLYNQDSEIAIQVLGESDGIFGSGDSIIFYGQKNNTRYSDTKIYWLTVGVTNGLRMTISDGTPGEGSTPSTFNAMVHSETEGVYSSADFISPDHNHWYWELINSAAPRTYNISLTKVNITASQAHVRVFLKGYAASPQQLVRISINGHLISEASWPARGQYTFNADFPQTYLLEAPSTNAIQVECPLTGGITVNQVLLDWIEIEYTKNYSADSAQIRFSGDTAGTWKYRLTGLSSNNFLTWDITDPLHPASITNTTFEPSGSTFDLVFQQTISSKRLYLTTPPSNLLTPASIAMAKDPVLHSPSNAADYIIITHPLFKDAIQPLADFYIGRGLRVKVIDVMDIYDEFSNGALDPEAIHAFLSYAYASWTRPAPSFVLLVGDGNYDFKNFYNRNDPIFIPPYLAEVDPWMGETDADNRFVTLSGDVDHLPDMALGRLPVKTDVQVNAAVAKITDHYQHLSGEWVNNALFVAGTNDPAAGNFPALSDTVINTYIPTSVSVDKIYYGFNSITSGVIARQEISTAIKTGRGLVHFIGHSNQYAWFGDISVPDSQGTIMLDKATVAGLSNTNMYPVVISMTCYTGYFVNPGLISLDESLIRAEGKGAVATWSPTGQGVASGHDLLDSGFFRAIYQNNVLTIGLAANAAKYYLYANSNGLHRELIDTYILFGDPAMLYRYNPTAVDINYFRAAKSSGGVELSWETVAETTLGGFNLYRRELNGEFVKVNTDLIPPQKGGQSEGSAYTYLDTGALPGIVYEYKLDVIENSLQVLLNRTTLYWPYTVQMPVIQN